MKTSFFPTSKDVAHIKKFVKTKKRKDIKALKRDAFTWIRTAWKNKMDYEVTWFGVPIIQNPYDMILMQELIFDLKPDVIIETGIAHGGSLIYYASLLELLGKGRVIGVDIEMRDHNLKLLEKHPLIKRVTMIEGDSVDEKIITKIKKNIRSDEKVLVLLDSNHTKDHVYKELYAYKDFVSKNSYFVVFDTFMPYLTGLPGTKNFDKDSAMHAVKQFVGENKSHFVIDKHYNKFFVSSCPNGFIKRIS